MKSKNIVEKIDTYFRYMNADCEEDYLLKVRYLYKIFQVGINPHYSRENRKLVLKRLIENANNCSDINHKVLDLTFAYKMAKYNDFDISQVPIVKCPDTLELAKYVKIPEIIKNDLVKRGKINVLAFADSIQPDDEIAEKFNVLIQRDHFGLNSMYFLSDKVELDGNIDSVQKYNVYNKNLLLTIIYNIMGKNCLEMWLCFLNYEKPNQGVITVERNRITNIRDLSTLKESEWEHNNIQYYWIEFKYIEQGQERWFMLAMHYEHLKQDLGMLPDLSFLYEKWKKWEGETPDGFKYDESKWNLLYR